MPGTDVAIQAATQRGYEAVVLVILLLAGFSALGLIVRQLWTDYRELSQFVRTSLVEALAHNTRATTRLAGFLRKRPCLRAVNHELEEIEEEPAEERA
jgi:hypothetical protein